jgi:hypothetical protein
MRSNHLCAFRQYLIVLNKGPQQEVARLEIWVANNYPGCFPKRF